MQIRKHREFDYQRIDDIDAIPPFTKQEGNCLDELGQCIVQHGLHDRVGAALLHSHFPIADDETLLERFAADGSGTTTPVSDSAIDQVDIVPTLFGFDPTSQEPECIAFEYLQTINAPDLLSEDRSAFFAAALRVIARHNCSNRFGIAVDLGDLAVDEVLVESSDVANRLLTSRSYKKDQSRSFPTRETRWFWNMGQISAGQKCESRTVTVKECRQECKVVGGGYGQGAVWRHDQHHHVSYGSKYEHHTSYS